MKWHCFFLFTLSLCNKYNWIMNFNFIMTCLESKPLGRVRVYFRYDLDVIHFAKSLCNLFFFIISILYSFFYISLKFSHYERELNSWLFCWFDVLRLWFWLSLSYWALIIRNSWKSTGKTIEFWKGWKKKGNWE